MTIENDASQEDLIERILDLWKNGYSPAPSPEQHRSLTQVPGDLRAAYHSYIDEQIEYYKESVGLPLLLRIADEVVARIGDGPLTDTILVEKMDRAISRRLRLPGFRQWCKVQDFVLEDHPSLFDAKGAPLRHESTRAARLITLSEAATGQLIRELSSEPNLLHGLDPRRFEELVAELLARDGCDVHLTPSSKDGGYDILARVRTAVGSFLCLVECKRYAPNRPVGVRPVRELFGLVTTKRAAQGIIVTTSNFTRGATSFRDEVPHVLSLRAYQDVVDWLKRLRLGLEDKPAPP